jgi:hypothetical protein
LPEATATAAALATTTESNRQLPVKPAVQRRSGENNGKNSSLAAIDNARFFKEF